MNINLIEVYNGISIIHELMNLNGNNHSSSEENIIMKQVVVVWISFDELPKVKVTKLRQGLHIKRIHITGFVKEMWL